MVPIPRYINQLGNRKVPCKLPCTPEVSKMPKIVDDAQERMSRRRLSVLWDPTNGCCRGSNTTKCDKGRERWKSTWIIVLTMLIIFYFLFSGYTHIVKGRLTCRFILNSPYKGIAKCMIYKNPAYTVCTMLRDPLLKWATLTKVVNVSD